MCLGVPARVIEVAGRMATVDVFGMRRQMCLDVVDEPVEPGDHVLSHAGFAIRRIPDDEVQETLGLYETLLQAAEDDLTPSGAAGDEGGGWTRTVVPPAGPGVDAGRAARSPRERPKGRVTR